MQIDLSSFFYRAETNGETFLPPLNKYLSRRSANFQSNEFLNFSKLSIFIFVMSNYIFLDETEFLKDAILLLQTKFLQPYEVTYYTAYYTTYYTTDYTIYYTIF